MTAATTKNILTDAVSAQEIFDHATAHMIRQGKTAFNIIDDEPNSRYRDRHGNSCAIGCMLTDAEAKKFEGAGVAALAERGLLPERFAGHVLLLKDLQSAHDDAAFIGGDCLASFMEEAPAIAEKHGLTLNAEGYVHG